MGSLYIYALIPASEQLSFEVAASGSPPRQVYSIAHRDLAAIVSPSALAEYRGLKREDAARHLLAHQRVIETVLESYPVLPVRFGTTAPDEASVRLLLARGEDLFHAAFEEFSGRTQMEVVVLWNLEDVFREIAEEEPIAQCKARLASQGADESNAERVVLGKMVKASLERRRQALEQRIVERLSEIALRTAANPLMDDRMVLNLALLVDKAQADALDRRLDELDAELEGRLHFRRVGPLAPHSFATVEARFLPFDAVDQARRRLRLGLITTAGEIRASYHALAARTHPDRNPARTGAEARMAELTEAYRLLTTYAEAQIPAGTSRQGPKQTRTCLLTRDNVERTVLIAVRGQEVAAQGADPA